MKALYFKKLNFFALRFLWIGFILLLPLGLLAQVPANDNCETAKLLRSVKDYCEDFTTVGATAGTLSAPICWSTTGQDVWFSFIAVATEVSVTIRNKTTSTTPSPEAVLYTT